MKLILLKFNHRTEVEGRAPLRRAQAHTKVTRDAQRDRPHCFFQIRSKAWHGFSERLFPIFASYVTLKDIGHRDAPRAQVESDFGGSEQRRRNLRDCDHPHH